METFTGLDGNIPLQLSVTNSSNECSIPCNLCGSQDVEEILSVDRDSKYLRTVLCKDCGPAWTDPRPNAEEIKQFYTENYRVAYKGTYPVDRSGVAINQPK